MEGAAQSRVMIKEKIDALSEAGNVWWAEETPPRFIEVYRKHLAAGQDGSGDDQRLNWMRAGVARPSSKSRRHRSISLPVDAKSDLVILEGLSLPISCLYMALPSASNSSVFPT